MISLETARKLNNAGLKWEPRPGDWFYHNDELLICGEDNGGECIGVVGWFEGVGIPKKGHPDITFAPRLDQLLAEIKKRTDKHPWYIDMLRLGHNPKNIYGFSFWGDGVPIWSCIDLSSEEAAAQALLWILEKGASPQ